MNCNVFLCVGFVLLGVGLLLALQDPTFTSANNLEGNKNVTVSVSPNDKISEVEVSSRKQTKSAVANEEKHPVIGDVKNVSSRAPSSSTEQKLKKLFFKHKVRAREECVKNLEELSSAPPGGGRRGKWNRILMRSIKQGSLLCAPSFDGKFLDTVTESTLYKKVMQSKSTEVEEPTDAAVEDEKHSKARQWKGDVRRVFIDIGSNVFGSGLTVYSHWYARFSEFHKIYALDANPKCESSFASAERRNFFGEKAGNLAVQFLNLVMYNTTGYVLFHLKNENQQHFKGRQLDQLNSASNAGLTFLPNFPSETVRKEKGIITGEDLLYSASDPQLQKSKSAKYLLIPAMNICDFFQKYVLEAVDKGKAGRQDSMSSFFTKHYTYVGVKIDVEGGEWLLLDALEKNCPDILRHTIDELFLECHYIGMAKLYENVPFTQCRKIYQKMRDKYHILSHEWV